MIGRWYTAGIVTYPERPMPDELLIRADATPNPNSLKFAVNRTLWEARAQTFSDPMQAFASPLARDLLAINGVRSIFLLRDFVTVSRDPGAAWEAIIEEVERVLRRHFAAPRDPLP